MESKNSSIISALNYLRTNKPSLEEMRELYGSEGAFAFNTFQARYSGVRKLKDGRTSKEKREQVIDELIDDLNKKKIRNPIKDAKRQELITNILIAIAAFVGAALLLVFGWGVILFVPPIWLIIFLIIWIIKKK